MTIQKKLIRSLFFPIICIMVVLAIIMFVYAVNSLEMRKKSELKGVVEGIRETMIALQSTELSNNGIESDGRLISVIDFQQIQQDEMEAILAPELLTHLLEKDHQMDALITWSEDETVYALAPIIGSEGKRWIVASDRISLQKEQKSLFGIFLMITIFIIGLILAIFQRVISSISRPIQDLRNAAVVMASGEGMGDIEIQGPREIVELANSFNAMGAYLKENISRIKERSIARELLYGEHEAAVILQEYMFDREAEKLNDPRFECDVIHIYSSMDPSGLLLQGSQEGDQLNIQLTEAVETGMQGIYNLVKHKDVDSSDFSYPNLVLNIDLKKLTFHVVRGDMPQPLIYSLKDKQCYLIDKENFSLSKGDYLFCFNSTYFELIEEGAQIPEWFTRILNHFASDGLNVVSSMLKNELNFIAQKSHIKNDIKVFCVKL